MISGHFQVKFNPIVGLSGSYDCEASNVKLVSVKPIDRGLIIVLFQFLTTIIGTILFFHIFQQQKILLVGPGLKFSMILK